MHISLSCYSAVDPQILRCSCGHMSHSCCSLVDSQILCHSSRRVSLSCCSVVGAQTLRHSSGHVSLSSCSVVGAPIPGRSSGHALLSICSVDFSGHISLSSTFLSSPPDYRETCLETGFQHVSGQPSRIAARPISETGFQQVFRPSELQEIWETAFQQFSGKHHELQGNPFGKLVCSRFLASPPKRALG